jgi:cob(I)alamin adenosyltransferase
MANRLTKIVTRTGDDGSTGLADGSRLAKSAPRVETLGAVDELNSAIGLLLTEAMPDELRACLDGVQHDLFDLGGELSIPGHVIMSEAHCRRIDDAITAFNAELPPLKEFILPGGTRAAALAHVARTACRRAERALVALVATAPVAPPMLQYINRLSDLLFVLARALNRHGGRSDVSWQQGKNRAP